MATIVTRAGKGAPLTHNEVDANFTNLNSDKVETSAISAFGATLVDDADAAAARTTLGLGTAATTASTDYATAAQGALADSATQPGDNISTLTNDAGYASSLSDLSVTASATELNVLDGITATTTELNYTDGVTSNIQTQLNDKAPINNATFTGTTVIPTADINGGTIDGTVIGGTIPAAISGTTGTFSGNVGIGTSSPLAKLHVQPSGSDGRVLFGGSASSGYSTHINVTDTGMEFWAQSNLRGLTFSTGSTQTERMRITSSGNVGIGTSSPSAAFQVGSGTAAIPAAIFSGGDILYEGRLLPNSASSNGTAAAPTVCVGFDYDTGLFSPATNAIGFTTGGTERMRIDASGNVGIGTSNPAYRLSVGTGDKIGFSSGTNYGYFEPYSLSGNMNFMLNWAGGSTESITFGTSGTERMRIDALGSLLVNATAADYSEYLKVSSAISYTFHSERGGTGSEGHVVFSNANGAVGTIITSGSSTAYNTTSDYRLKENVVPLAGAADRLMQIPVHRFNFIADPATTVDGFLAHEVQAFVPEAITGTKDEVDADGNPVYQGIDQSKLVPLLTAALQEALTEIADLKARVTALEAQP